MSKIGNNKTLQHNFANSLQRFPNGENHNHAKRSLSHFNPLP